MAVRDEHGYASLMSPSEEYPFGRPPVTDPGSFQEQRQPVGQCPEES
jgi:hypothetical protein